MAEGREKPMIWLFEQSNARSHSGVQTASKQYRGN